MGSNAVTPPNNTEIMSRLSAGNRMGCWITKAAPERSSALLDSVLPDGGSGLGEDWTDRSIPTARMRTTQTNDAEPDTPIQPKKSPPRAGPEIRATCKEDVIQAEARGSCSLSMIRGTSANIAGWEKARAAPVRKEETNRAEI